MNNAYLKNMSAYQRLAQKRNTLDLKELDLKHLTEQADRFDNCTINSSGFFYDYSKQRVNDTILAELLLLAKEKKIKSQFEQMTTGGIVNTTENRAALHTAARNYEDNEINLGKTNVCHLFKKVNHSIKTFSENVHDGLITGSTGKTFSDAVVVGIGGSYLGCEFVYSALKVYAEPVVALHFMSNVDIDLFGQIIKKMDPEKTLWIVVSKSYTTTETMANLNQVSRFIEKSGLNIEEHLVTITAKGSPGDNPSNPVLATFHMFDFIGGRFSVTSAVGGVPLSLAFGFGFFKRFLEGCHIMDTHALSAPENKNMPLLSALISIWNSHFLSYRAQAVIPYSSALSRLAPHIQQLYMESLGKCATKDGEKADYPTGVIIFGEPGTNAQHSFFQLAHQGQPFPIDFIGVVNPVFKKHQRLSKGVTNHQELWANMIAQAKALAVGRSGQDQSRHFEGNRPSSTILIPDLSPESIGKLLAFYEARTVFEGFLLDLNPFDQFGVELGKKLASDIRQDVARNNKDAGYGYQTHDPATRFYLDVLFNRAF